MRQSVSPTPVPVTNFAMLLNLVPTRSHQHTQLNKLTGIKALAAKIKAYNSNKSTARTTLYSLSINKLS